VWLGTEPNWVISACFLVPTNAFVALRSTICTIIYIAQVKSRSVVTSTIALLGSLCHTVQNHVLS